MQNSENNSEGNTRTHALGVGEERELGNLFSFSENVLMLSYGVGKAEFKNFPDGNTSGTRSGER